MERKSLLNTLELVAPALDDGTMVPILSHFWFNRTHVMAYNDRVAISAPLKSDIMAAVPGTILVNLLRNSRAKELEFELLNDKELKFKLGGTRLKLATLPSADTEIFTMPKPDESAILSVATGPFLAGLEDCMRSTSSDTQTPEFGGVTIVGKKDGVDLYATNGKTMSAVSIKRRNGATVPTVILPTAFCKQVLRLVKVDDPLRLELHKDHALLVTKAATVFCRLIRSDKPLDFAYQISHHFPETEHKKLVPIPDKLRLILERAVITSDAPIDETYTEIVVKDGRARFTSRGPKNEREAVDNLALEQHPDVSLTVRPKALRAGYGAFDKMLMKEGCVVMVRENTLYMVATKAS